MSIEQEMAGDMSRRRDPIIGLFMSGMSGTAPRGVTRVVRGVAEAWVGSEHVQLLALSDPIYHHHDILFSACPLADWLPVNPLVRDSGPLPSATSEYEPVSINDLDAIVSFECYDPIWDWPTEMHSCRMIGVFHDAVPFRIDEKDDPSRYYRAVGKMVSRAHLIFCDSKASLSDFRTFFPAGTAKSCLLYLGHDVDRFLPQERCEDETQLTRERSATGHTIAMIGALEPARIRLLFCMLVVTWSRRRRAIEPGCY